MPGYAKDGTAPCFFQVAGKFKVRYATIGFQHNANLDNGELWLVSFALPAFTDEVDARVRDIVARAAEWARAPGVKCPQARSVAGGPRRPRSVG